MKNFLNTFREILKYPSAIFGAFVVLVLVVASIVVVVKIPYSEAINIWRGGEEIVGKNPRNVPPIWYNWFRKDKLVVSLDMNEGDEGVYVEETVTEGGTHIKTTTFEIDYQYNSFPQDLVLYFTSTYNEKQPFVSVKIITPDEREIKAGSFAIGTTYTYPFNQDDKLRKKLGGVVPNVGLFIQEGDESQQVVQGT